jgi:hypothetical protein
VNARLSRPSLTSIKLARPALQAVYGSITDAQEDLYIGQTSATEASKTQGMPVVSLCNSEEASQLSFVTCFEPDATGLEPIRYGGQNDRTNALHATLCQRRWGYQASR